MHVCLKTSDSRLNMKPLASAYLHEALQDGRYAFASFSSTFHSCTSTRPFDYSSARFSFRWPQLWFCTWVLSSVPTPTLLVMAYLRVEAGRYAGEMKVPSSSMDLTSHCSLRFCWICANTLFGNATFFFLVRKKKRKCYFSSIYFHVFFMQDPFNQVLFIFTNVSIKSLRHQIRPNLIDMFETLMSFFEYRCLRECSCLEKFQKSSKYISIMPIQY